jgi:hypothetical protein
MSIQFAVWLSVIDGDVKRFWFAAFSDNCTRKFRQFQFVHFRVESFELYLNSDWRQRRR